MGIWKGSQNLKFLENLTWHLTSHTLSISFCTLKLNASFHLFRRGSKRKETEEERRERKDRERKERKERERREREEAQAKEEIKEEVKEEPEDDAEPDEPMDVGSEEDEKPLVRLINKCIESGANSC